MLLQPSSLHQRVSLPSTLSHSRSLPSGFRSVTGIRTILPPKQSVVCSISQVHSYGTVDYERRPMVKWNTIFRRISLMENPEKGSGSVLDQCEKEGIRLSKWALCRVVKELRKFKKYNLALGVYEWMNDKKEKFKLFTSDLAIQLDLIAKVWGISSAEEHFMRLPDTLKDKRIYGALLNAYVWSKMGEKAELLFEKMRGEGYATESLPFNVMMTLYMKLKKYDKVESMISEMMKKNIQLDIYSYNIWISCRGSQGSAQRMEQVFEQMKLDRTINPNWSTFSTLASMYLKLGQFEKVEDCLKKVETRIVGRDRIPYHFLMSLYGKIGNKEEVHRVWNIYKYNFPSIPNSGYHAVISSLFRAGDIEGAEKIYEEWLPVKLNYDPRIGNIFMAGYVRGGLLEKAEGFLDHMVKVGGKPNSSSWEILAEGHIRDKRIPEALACLKEATVAEGSRNWRPRPGNVSLFLELCEEKDDSASKEVLMGLLRQVGCLDEVYMSLLQTPSGPLTGLELPLEKERTEDGLDNQEAEDEGVGMLSNELQSSL